MDPSLSILADVEALLARGPGDRLLHLREADGRRAELAAAAAAAKAKRDAAVMAVWQRMRPGVLVRARIGLGACCPNCVQRRAAISGRCPDCPVCVQRLQPAMGQSRCIACRLDLLVSLHRPFVRGL